MRQNHDARALVGELDYGRREPYQSGLVGHFPISHRHIKVGAHQDPAAGDIKVIESQEITHS